MITPGGIHLYDHGGPDGAVALLLMHGLTDSGECWGDAVPRWVDRYRVLSWDARGHGRSARFTTDQLEAGVGETMLADAIAVLEHLRENGIDRPLLVGHSMGGGTAGAVAATRPDLVRGTVLEDPALGQDPDETEADRLSAGRDRVADARLWLEQPEAALAKGRRENPDWPEAEYAGWLASKTQTDLAMLATGQARLRRTWLDVARDIACPTLLLTGDDDMLWGDAERDQVAALGNPQVRLERIAGAGHCIRRTRPEQFHALVDPWLAGHASMTP